MLWAYRRLSTESTFAKEYPSLFSFVESPLSVSLWRDKLKALRSVYVLWQKLVTLENNLFLDDFSQKRGITKSYPTIKYWLFIFKIAVLDQLRALFNSIFLQPTLAFTFSTECP